MAFTGKTNYGPDSGVFSAGTPTTMQEGRVDFEQCDELLSNRFGDLAKSFMGIPVRVDPELKGMEYFIVVSPELLAEIEKSDDSGPGTAPST